MQLSGHNRAFILSIINKILESSHVSENLDEQQALLIINLVTQEITISKVHKRFDFVKFVLSQIVL